MGIDVSKIGSTLLDQFVGFSSEKIYPNNFLAAKAIGEGNFGRNPSDGYGGVLAITENYAVVGVPNQSYDYQGQNLETGSGAVYVYERDANTWVYLQKISIPTNDRATANSFGFSVAVDGSTIVVGAPGVHMNNGSAYVYQYADNEFRLTQTLTPTGTNAVGTGDKFGSSVAVKGDMIVVGAPLHDYDNTGQNLLTDAGAAWVFVYDSMSLVWNQVQKIAEEGSERNQNDYLGYSMASTDAYLVVGAYHHSYTDDGLNYVSNAGAAYVWYWSSVENNWEFSQKITPAKRCTNGYFGSSVSIDGTTIVVGAPGYTDGTAALGAFSVFELQNSDWVETAFFMPDLLSYASTVNITGTNIGFANDVAVKGSTIAVTMSNAPLYTGTTFAGRGAVAVYDKSDSWQISQVIPSPYYGNSLASTADNFGSSVSLGVNSMVIGFPNDSYDDTNTNTVARAGSVYLYTRGDSGWTIEQKIVGWGQDRNSGDLLGAAIWYQDGYAFVGAPGHSYDVNGTNFLAGAGAVFIWQWSGAAWTYVEKITASNRHAGDGFGSTIAGDTGIVAIGSPTATLDVSGLNSTANAGSVSIFNYVNGNWTFTQEIVASTRNINDGFGTSISVSGNDILVGMPTNSTSTDNVYSTTYANCGAAEFFTLSSGSWTFVHRVFAGDNRASGDKFGTSVSINSGVAVIGAPLHAYDSDGLHPLTGAGAAWIYTKNDVIGLWNQTTKITGWGQDRNTSDYMGWSSASDGGTLVVGVPNHAYDVNGRNYISNAGAVLVYIWYNGGWFFQQKIVAQTNRLANSYFGYAVDISGDTLIVGAPQCGTYGTAYIFNRTYGVWTQSAELPFTPFRSDYATHFSAPLYTYGASVAIDGTNIIIGHPWGYSKYHDTYFSGQGAEGCAYTYSKINGTWTLETTLTGYREDIGIPNGAAPADNFGITVSVKDGIAVVGTPTQSYDDSGANFLTNAGAAYIYRRTANGSSFVWKFDQKLAGGSSDRYSNDQMGSASAVYGNTIAVSAINHPYDSNDTNFFAGAGAVYVWTVEDNQLVFQQKITAVGTNSRNTNAYFGSSIALIDNMIAISAPGTTYDVNGFSVGTNYGAVFVYVRTNGNWAIQEWISSPSFSSNKEIIPSTTGVANQYFGYDISMNVIGSTTRLLVGCPNFTITGIDDNSSAYTGAAFSYTYDSSNYIWDFEKMFENPYSVSNSFSKSVALIDNIAVIGCPAATNINSYENYSYNPGAASIYSYDNGRWVYVSEISSPNRDNLTGDNSSVSIDIDGDTMVIGAPNNSVDDNGVGNSNAGASYVFNWNGSEWLFAKKLTAPGYYRNNGDLFGTSVSVSGDNILIGAPTTSIFGSKNTSVPTTKNMIHYYPLNNNLRDNITDGILEGSESYGNTLPDGTGSTLFVDRQTIIGPNVKTNAGFSVSLWINIQLLDGGWSTILGQYNSNVSNTNYWDYYIGLNNTGQIRAYTSTSAGHNEVGIETGISMVSNTWYNLCFVIDPTNGLLNFFVNGKKFTTPYQGKDLSWFSSNNFQIGKTDAIFDIFDVRIYDVAISDTDVASIYGQYTTSNISSAGAAYLFKKSTSKVKRTPRHQIMNSDTTWTVPASISDSTVKVSMWGGAGGASGTASGNWAVGSAGGFVSLRVPVKSGDTLQGLIGQAGGANAGAPGVTSGGLYKGGQGLNISGKGVGGSGGSASALLLNGSTIAVAAGGAGAMTFGNQLAPGIPVASSNLFTDTTSGQDAISGTNFTLAGGGGGYRGGQTSLPVTSAAYMAAPANSGMSWVSDTISTSFKGTSINPVVVDGSSTVGYNGTAGSVNRITSHNGMIVIEWYENETVYDYDFVQQITPTGTNAHMASDYFGYSVGISGNDIIIGAPYHDYDETGASPVTDAGAAWVFNYDGTQCSQVSKITGEGSNSRNANDWFGYSVSIDGDFAIVGAPQHGYDDYGANLVSNNGAAWVFQKTDSGWVSTAKLVEFGRDKNTGDKLGTSIACDGTTLVVGSTINSYDASLDASGTASYTNLNYMANSGSAYIWEWNTSTSAWDFKQKIVASDRFAGEQFGNMVSISNEKILIGTNNISTTNSSSAYLFEKTGKYPSAWVQTREFSNTSYTNYGGGVAIDGTTIVVTGTNNPVNDNSGITTSKKIITDGIDGNLAVIGTSDFTAECWIYPVSVSTDWPFIGSSNYVYHKGAPTWGLYFSSVSGIVADNGTDRSKNPVPSNTSSHIAWTRTKGVSYIWINGTLATSFSDTTDYSDPGVFIANQNSNYVQSLRLTIGKSLYSADFTPSVLTQTADTTIFYSKSATIMDIYDFDGTTWNKTASFEGQANVNDSFGSSVALNKEHGMILVGAPTRSFDSSNTNALSGAGVVFSYLRNTDGTWSDNQIITGTGQDSCDGDMIGSSIAADGEVMAIGSVNHAYDADGENFMTGAGAVWIWRYFGATPSWHLEQKLVASDRAPGDAFGSSISISGNTLAVGAPAKSSGAGSVYIFTRPSSTVDGTVNCWKQTIILNPTGTNAVNAGDKFGFSVSIQETTSSLLVGAPYHGYDTTGDNFLSSAGAAWAFSNTNGTWTQTQKLIANGVMNGVPVPNARNANDYFGFSVGLKDNSSIIGATGHQYDKSGTNPLTNAGAAFLFMRTDNAHPWSPIIKFTGDSPERNTSDQYGFSVASTANTIVIGSPNQSYDGNGAYWVKNAGAVYVWVNGSSGWTLQQKLSAQDGSLDGNVLREVSDNFGYSVAISGDTLVVGIPNRSTDVTGATAMSNAGAIMIFKRSNGAWTKYGNMIQGSDTVAGDTFGTSIDFDGTTIAVGAPLHSLDSKGSNSLSHAGAVYLFTDSGTAFAQSAKITPTGTNARNANDNFGTSVCVKAGLLVVGAINHSYDDIGTNSVSNSGAVWIFTRDGNIWSQMDKVGDFTPRRMAGDAFGSTSYAFSDTYVVVGAPGYDYDMNMRNYAAGAGAIYIFTRNNNTFNFMQILTPLGTNMRSAGDAFGSKVAISGTTIVASSPMASFDSTGGTTAGNTGLVFVFDFDGKQFHQTSVLSEFGSNANQSGDNFGYDISIDGDFMAVSSIAHSYDASGSNSITAAGAVWLFHKDNTKGWTKLTKITPTGLNARNLGDNFGFSIDIDGTNLKLVASAINHKYDAAGLSQSGVSGAAWTFGSTTDDISTWTQIHKLSGTGAERTSTDKFGIAASYNKAGYLAIADQNTTDSWYENSVDGSGSVHIYKSSQNRLGVKLDGQSAYMDVSSVAKSITDTTWSISTWMKSTSKPTSSITHNCLYSVKHGDEIMRIYATPDNYIRITYGLVRIDANISVQSLFDNNWHNLIVSGLGATSSSGITIYIDGRAISVTAYVQPIEYPTDYVGFYSMDGIASDSTHTYGDITNASFGDASTLQTNREGLSITGSIIPSIETSFITNTTMSLSFWVNGSQATASTGNTALITQLISSDGTAAGTKFLLSVSCNNKGQFFVLYNNSAAVTSSVALSPSTWYNVVVMIDPTNSKLSISVNNTLTTGTLTTTGATANTPLLFGSAGTYTNDTITGMIPNYSNFVGLITDLKIYNRTLTSEEIGHLYKEFDLQPIDNNEAITSYGATVYATNNTNGHQGNYTIHMPTYLNSGTGIEFIFYLTTLSSSMDLFIASFGYDDWRISSSTAGAISYISTGGGTRRTLTVPGLVVGWNKISAFNNSGTMILNVNGTTGTMTNFVKIGTTFTLYVSNSVILQSVMQLTANQLVSDYTTSPYVGCYVDFTNVTSPTVHGGSAIGISNYPTTTYTPLSITGYLVSSSKSMSATTFDAGIIPASGDSILVGAGYNKDGSVGELFTGAISDTAIINGSVSATDAQAIASSGKNSSISGGIVGNWLV